MNNAERSNRFEVAILAIRDDYGEAVEEVIIDLLTDARHWCDENDRSFADLDRMAREHYDAERPKGS